MYILTYAVRFYRILKKRQNGTLLECMYVIKDNNGTIQSWVKLGSYIH